MAPVSEAGKVERSPVGLQQLSGGFLLCNVRCSKPGILAGDPASICIWLDDMVVTMPKWLVCWREFGAQKAREMECFMKMLCYTRMAEQERNKTGIVGLVGGESIVSCQLLSLSEQNDVGALATSMSISGTLMLELITFKYSTGRRSLGTLGVYLEGPSWKF